MDLYLQENAGFKSREPFIQLLIMKHSILLSLLAFALCSTPALAANEYAEPAAEVEETAAAGMTTAEVSLVVRGNTVQVMHAQGALLEVFDITGKCVVSMRIDSQDKTVHLALGKGYYIVRVGKVTRKVSLS